MEFRATARHGQEIFPETPRSNSPQANAKAAFQTGTDERGSSCDVPPGSIRRNESEKRAPEARKIKRQQTIGTNSTRRAANRLSTPSTTSLRQISSSSRFG